jgi:REP element-mobilizing transposase RayT
MPNHIHGIINIIDDAGSRHSELDFNKYQKIISGSIGSIIRSYKSAVTKWVHQNTSTQNVWLRNYYEHIIQNDKELDQIREYIKFNPLNWQIKKNEHLNKYW